MKKVKLVIQSKTSKFLYSGVDVKRKATHEIHEIVAGKYTGVIYVFNNLKIEKMNKINYVRHYYVKSTDITKMEKAPCV